MATVTVTPTEWQYVFFDTATITAIVEKLVGEIGVDRDVHVEVDESTPLGRAKVTALDPAITLSIEGGAFEDPKRPRHLSERGVADVTGRWLLRSRDRLDPAFGDPPPDEELTLSQVTAWDTYCVGRLAGLGYPVQRQRRLYHFRNRHGFSDIADAAFERLWHANGLTWADIQAVCDETAPTRTPVG